MFFIVHLHYMDAFASSRPVCLVIVGLGIVGLGIVGLTALENLLPCHQLRGFVQ